MPDFAILIYADESLRVLEAAEADLEENDQHPRDLQASGSMSPAYALTPRAEAVSIRRDDTTCKIQPIRDEVPPIVVHKLVAYCDA